MSGQCTPPARNLPGDITVLERFAHAPVFFLSSSTKRFAHGDAAVTFAGSILANSLNECSPFRYGALVLQLLVACCKARYTAAFATLSTGFAAAGNALALKPGSKKVCSVARSARNQLSIT